MRLRSQQGVSFKIYVYRYFLECSLESSGDLHVFLYTSMLVCIAQMEIGRYK